MGCRRIVSTVLMIFLLCRVARGEDAKPPTLDHHRELARLLNIIKKAPQRAYREQARKELERTGVPMLQVVFALTLDHWLRESDPIVRYRASTELAEMKSPARIVAAGNLRNLIAAEDNPYLKWQHASALSAIDPQSGSAFELMNRIPDDPTLRRTLLLDRKAPSTTPRFDSGLAISEITLSEAEYWELSQTLRLEHLGPPAEAPLIEEYESPAATRIQELPPPPPRKIPAHPLIANRQFAEILKQMDQGSEEAWQLFSWYGAEFPPEAVTKIYLPRAFGPDWRERERAMQVLWSAGPDAEKAAALIYAVTHDLCIAHHVEMIERMKVPGHYSQQVLEYLRRHENPRVRMAVIGAMNRTPEMKKVLVETVQDSLRNDNLAMKRAVLKTLPGLKMAPSVIQPWLEEQLLTSENPELLSSVVNLLKGMPATKEFQQQVFSRIDGAKLAERDLILMQFLADQVAAESKAGKRLQTQFQKARSSLESSRTEQKLEEELRWMIQEAEAIKQLANQEAIESLLILTDD